MSNRYDGDERRHRPRGLQWDPKISLGNVVTIISLLSGVVLGWSNLDKRVVVLEEQRKSLDEKARMQDARVADRFIEVKEALGDLKLSVERLRDKIDTKK